MNKESKTESFIRKKFPKLIPFLRPLKKNFRKIRYKLMSSESIFTEIYQTNKWGDKETRSGSGSNLEQTAIVRQELSNLLKELQVSSLLDIPCGDFYWLKEVNLDSISYIGADIVNDVIKQNIKKYSKEGRLFKKLDIKKDPLPKVDLILCRDLFIHFSFKDINKTINNIKKSNSSYILTTSYLQTKNNNNIVTGEWHPLNLLAPPFSFKKPLKILDEKGDEAGKSLLLWKIADINEIKL